MSRYEVSWPGGSAVTVSGPGVSLVLDLDHIDMGKITEALDGAFEEGAINARVLAALGAEVHRQVSPTGCSCGEVFADGVLLGRHIGQKMAQQ